MPTAVYGYDQQRVACMNPYHPSAFFWIERALIQDALQASSRFSAVWRIASGIPQQNGVGFAVGRRPFKIHWQQGQWYLLGQQLVVCCLTRQELIDCCLLLTNQSMN